MSFTRSTEDIKVHQSLSDYPSEEDGMTTEELKQTFDKPGTILQRDFNKVLDELESSTSASNIGASALYTGDESGTVQEKLNKIYTSIQNIVLNEIPDGSVTSSKLAANSVKTISIEDGAVTLAKLNTTLSSVIAFKKDLAVALGNAKYHTPTITNGGDGTSFSSSIIPIFSSNDPVDGYKVSGQANNLYHALDGNINSYANIVTSSSSKPLDLIVEAPQSIKISKIQLALYHSEGDSYITGLRTACSLFGSNNGTDWDFIANPNRSSSLTDTSINSTKFYKFYMVRLVNNRDGYNYTIGIREFKIVEGYVASEDTYDTLNINLGGLEAYESYQKLSIKVPSTYRNRNLIAKVKIDNLDTKLINKYIKPNTLIDLTYNGTEFI